MKCSTVFLDEEARNDLLPAHAGVLEDLTAIVENDGGRVVALVGPYGSGKTTIVRKFENTPREHLHVFVFDAWAHRGDVLRRTLVTQLERFLTERRLIDTGDRDAVYGAMTRQPDRATALLQPLMFIPTAILAVATILARVTSDAWTPTLWGIALTAMVLFLVALSAGRTKTITVTDKAADLTSQEFQEAFAKAVSAALRPRSERRLIVALDDLDRLTADEADEVVTVLRIFFDSRREIPEFTRLWFLVPFDAGSMRKNLEKRGLDTLQKLFAISIDVPPPNLPASSEVFEKRFLAAFPEHTALEAQQIHSMLLQKEGGLTLRRVTSFINRVASLHMRWCERSIPVVDLAGYALVSQEIDVTKIETITRPAGVSDQWHRHVAALYFNVDPKDTDYVVRGNDIEMAMLSGHTDVLQELSRTSGFTETATRVLNEKAEQLASTPQQLGNVIYAFGANAYGEIIWERLVGIAKDVKKWPADADLRPFGLLLRHASARDRRVLAARIFTALAGGLRLTSEAQGQEFERWLANVVTLREAAGSDVPARAIDTLGGSELFRLEVLRAIESGRLVYPATPPVTVHDDDKAFLLDFASRRLEDDSRAAVRHFVSLLGAMDWTSTFDAGEATMSYASVLHAGHVAIGRVMELFAMVERYAERPEATERLDLYGGRGDFLQLAIKSWGAPTETPAIMLALLAMRRSEVIGNSVRFMSIQSDLRDRAQEILEFLRDVERNEPLFATIRAVHARLGVEDDSRQLLENVARVIDEKGGIELIEVTT